MKKATSIERNAPVNASAAHSDHFHSFQTTKNAREVVATIVPETAMPYALAKASDERKSNTSARTPNRRMRVTRGMKICPSWVEEVWTISRRGSNPSWIAWLASE